MTATDELRRMLDERGVEYEDETDEDGWAFTRWHGFDDTGWLAASDELCGLLDLRGRYLFTPEQAIEATLGPAAPPQEPPVVPYDLLIDLLRDEWDIDVMWDGLRRFWYVGLTEEGVRKRDEREATLGRGTCHIVKTWSDSDFVDGWRYRCSECMCFIPVNERDPETGDAISAANYCPNCGRRCVG